MPYWDERFRAVGIEFPDIETDQYHIDILTARFVTNPEWFDVVVGSNLFGDILSDLGPAVAGSIGIAPSGNINPEKNHPSMFEPVHGSAPSLAGKNVANPVGAILSAALMLRYLGAANEAGAIETAVKQAVVARQGTKDIGGTLGTRETGDYIANAIRRSKT